MLQHVGYVFSLLCGAVQFVDEQLHGWMEWKICHFPAVACLIVAFLYVRN